MMNGGTRKDDKDTPESRFVVSWVERGKKSYRSGDYRDAIFQFQRGIREDPGQAAPYCWLGIVYARQGSVGKAVACHKKALACNPDFQKANYQLGLLYLKEGALARSRDCFARIVEKDSRNWRAWVNLCTILRDLGELLEAEAAGQRAVAIQPGSFQAWHNLANVYNDKEQFQDAQNCYKKALALNPDSSLANTGLGIAYQGCGDTGMAVKSFEKALSEDPTAATAVIHLFNIAMLECDWQQAAHYEKLVRRTTLESLEAKQTPAETPFINLTRSDDPELNKAVARAWSADIARRQAETGCVLDVPPSLNASGRIRIGYLSNNFGDHPTAHITRRLYELHDRSRFEITCFSYGPDDHSRYRQAIQEGCDSFVNIRKLSHCQAARAINKHGIQILVDLVGFMKGERLAISALRPTPVQVRWLGMAGTTGADFFDYIITDRTVTPPDQAGFYSEKFLYLPHCYQINDNRPLVKPDGNGRSNLGITENDFVFSCFNTSYKMNAVLFDVWMKILKRSPNSVLWLMADSEGMKERLRAAATQRGVDSSRLVFAAKVPKEQHLSRLAAADLALDTNQVNGAASTSDALWAGVPVLTLQGNHFASRMAASILKAAGIPSLIAHSLIEYEEKAVTLARDEKEFEPIKRTLQSAVTDSHLFNTEQFVRDLEKGYELIWNHHLKGEAPRLIEL